MKLICTFLFASLSLAQTAAVAQTLATAKPHPVAHTIASTSSCAKLPELSAKVPALPAGLPCAKPLYTLTTIPSIKLSGASPLAAPDIRETLGLESSTFSIDYIDSKVGTGAYTTPHKWYSIQYTGYLVDGTKFDSSYDKPDKTPFTFQQGQHQVVIGWDTGFYGMRVGGKRRLFIPWQLAYGPNAHGNIPPKSMLVFDVELISQSDKAPAPPASAKKSSPSAAPAPVHAPTPVTVHPAASVPAPAPTTAPASSTAPAPATSPQPSATKP